MNDTCPMIREKNGNELIAGIEYTEMEELGKNKMDILGVKGLDKLMKVNDLLQGIE
jgi:DNA polymerase III alpha subunit